MVEVVAVGLSCREMARTRAWEKTKALFNEDNFERAKTSFRLVVSLENMTDDEFESCCECDSEGCCCHQ